MFHDTFLWSVWALSAGFASCGDLRRWGSSERGGPIVFRHPRPGTIMLGDIRSSRDRGKSLFSRLGGDLPFIILPGRSCEEGGEGSGSLFTSPRFTVLLRDL